MAINKDFLMGFVSGTVVGAVGYRLYEQNSGQLKSLIQPTLNQFSDFGEAGLNGAEPTIVDLVEQKERLEDLIAEKQILDQN